MGVVDLFMPCSTQVMRFWCQAKDNCTTRKPLCGDKEATTIAFTALSSIMAIVKRRILIPQMNKG